MPKKLYKFPRPQRRRTRPEGFFAHPEASIATNGTNSCEWLAISRTAVRLANKFTHPAAQSRVPEIKQNWSHLTRTKSRSATRLRLVNDFKFRLCLDLFCSIDGVVCNMERRLQLAVACTAFPDRAFCFTCNKAAREHKSCTIGWRLLFDAGRCVPTWE